VLRPVISLRVSHVRWGWSAGCLRLAGWLLARNGPFQKPSSHQARELCCLPTCMPSTCIWTPNQKMAV